GETHGHRDLQVLPVEIPQRGAAQGQPDELGHLLRAEAEGRGALAVDPDLELGVAVPGVDAHVAQLPVARQDRHDVAAEFGQGFAGIADQVELHPLVAAHSALPAEPDVGARGLRQAFAQFLLDPRGDLRVLLVEVDLGARPALFAVARVDALDVEALAVGVDVALDPGHLLAHFLLRVRAAPLVIDADLARVLLVAAVAAGLGDRDDAQRDDRQDPGDRPSAMFQ